MKLEDQVCSLELSKRLKELGVQQNSLFYWYYTGYDLHEHFLQIGKNYDGDASPRYSAFTVPELLELLPSFINDWILSIDKYPSEYEVKYCDKKDEKRLEIEFDKNLVNACARILIRLLKNELITIDGKVNTY